MYHDDPYDPNLENDYDDCDAKLNPSHNMDDESSYYSQENDLSVSSNIKKQRKLIEDAKLQDLGFHRVYRKIATRDNTKVKKCIEFYETPIIMGATIRNAITGRYEHGMKVGSKSERLFFKMGLCTGETGQTPAHLYYDSPTEYEKHSYSTVSQEIKDKWLNAFTEEQTRRESVDKRRHVEAYTEII